MNFLARLENPVARRELAYQQHSIERRQQLRLKAAFRLVYYPALALGMLVFWSEFGAALSPEDTPSAAAVLQTVIIFTLVVAVLMQLYLLLQTLLRAAASIAREKEAGTWDDLLMTGTDARRLVIGKWWATLRGLLGGYLLLIPLRASVVVWLGAVFDRSKVITLDSVREMAAPGAAAFLATFPVIATFTFGAAMAVAAVGIFASAASRRLVTALAAALFLLVLVFGGTFGAVAFAYQMTYGNGNLAMPIDTETREIIEPAIERMLISWAENGLTLTSELVNYQPQYTAVTRQYLAERYAMQRSIARLVAFVICNALYLLITWSMLRGAQILVVRQGVLPRRK